MENIYQICCACDPELISLAFEPLLILSAQKGDTIDHLVINGDVARTLIQLAISYRYPQGYFEDPTLDSDTRLEIERNNVRDVIRSLGCLSENFLFHLLTVLESTPDLPVISSSSHGPLDLVPEYVIHAFSSLAKPLNRLVAERNIIEKSQFTVLEKALYLVGKYCNQLILIFLSGSYESCREEAFSISRLLCMAIASFSPFLSDICTSYKHEDRQLFHETLALSVFFSLLCLVHIPELATESRLGEVPYDIRGAMRGPGGEDHVACLVLMRLTKESNELACTIFNLDFSTFDGHSTSLIHRISKIIEVLKDLERQRGYHSTSKRVPFTTAMTRRIILRSLVDLVAKANHNVCRKDITYLENILYANLESLISITPETDI